jgi:hypothetical protein
MRTNSPSWLVGSALCLVGLTGCGSTVQMTSGRDSLSGSTGLSSSSGAPSALGGSTLGQGSGASSSAITGQTGSTAPRATTSHDPSSPTTGPGTLNRQLPAYGLGYTATTLKIGVTTNKDAQATLAAVGIASGSLGDQEAMTKAVMDDINAQGGVLGRKLVPVFHDVKTTETSTNPEAAAQAACAAFTQDTHVAAALELVLDSRDFADCLIKHRAFVVSSGLTFTDQTYVKGLSPYFFRLASPLEENLVPTYLARLTALGYFSPWDTVNGRPGKATVGVGLFYVDEPAPTRAFNDIATRLQAMGYKVTRYAYGRQDASYQSAVLKFQSAGVTHIIGDNASYAQLMVQAQSQHYYPRYGMTSYNGGGVLLQQVAPAAELAGALGVGWAPSVDVDGAHDPGSTGPAYVRCLATMHRHQVDVTTRAALANALGICDGLQVLAQSMRAGGGFDGPHITAGRATFSFEATATFSGLHNEGSIAIPTAVRDYGYLTSCSCFAYLSKTNHPLQ